MSKKYSEIFLQSILAGVIAFAVFLPITGIVIDGFSVEWHIARALWLSGAVVLLRGFILCFLAHPKTAQLWSSFYTKRHAPVTVQSPQPVKYTRTLILLAFLGLIAPFWLSTYWITVAILALIYVLLGLGLNIVVGLAGLLDLGFVAFYAVGAYGYALGHDYLGLNFWTAIPFSALLAATCGGILGFPVLRMHGDYLAIVTLGFGEIIRLLLNNMTEFTGGPNGISAPAPTLFGLEFTRRAKEGGVPFHEYFGIEYASNYRYIVIYLVLILFVFLAIYFVHRLKKMPLGRAWEALREDEIACRSLGINHVTTKLSAFSLGAMIGGIGGVFFAAYQGFVNPASFTFIESALILSIVVLGGMGSTLGVIIAALILSVLPEVLRHIADYRMLAFGGLMIAMMIVRPRGLIRIQRQYIPKPKGSTHVNGNLSSAGRVAP